MKVIVIAVSIAILFIACRNNTSVQSNADVRFDESSLPVESGTAETEDLNAEIHFIDTYSDKEYFNLDRYIVDAEDIPTDSIDYISETCFVQVFRPEIKIFEDEESEEAEAYYIAMDDLAYYMHQASERMEDLGISRVVSRLRFLRFDIVGEKPILIDTEKYGSTTFALLYKKGEKPLIIDMVLSYADDRIELYLGL